jgi:hypothetical protein
MFFGVMADWLGQSRLNSSWDCRNVDDGLLRTNPDQDTTNRHPAPFNFSVAAKFSLIVRFRPPWQASGRQHGCPPPGAPGHLAAAEPLSMAKLERDAIDRSAEHIGVKRIAASTSETMYLTLILA